MPLMQVLPQGLPASSLPDGTAVTLLGGRQGEGVVTELHGKYYVQAYRGKLWHLSITTASAIPLFATNATPNFFIWNPTGSGANVVLVRFKMGFHAGTGIAGAIGYSYITGVSSLTGTAAAVSAATLVTPQMGVVGNTYGGQTRGGSAATITGTAPYALTQHSWSNLSQGAPITSTASFWTLSEDFEGTQVIPPGGFWCPTASIAIAETVMISVIAYDAPI